MTLYEYGRIRKLAEELNAHQVDPAICEQVMAGGDEIKRGTTPKRKAAWFAQAMVTMDDLLDQQTRRVVREACACCLGGKRGQLSKAIAKEHDTLEERIAAANETPFVFGHSVTQQDDGSILVMFEASGKESYRCVCLRAAEGPVSETYCYCCGGHVKHHLQQALGRQVQCAVVHTALTTAGTEPCTFRFELMD